MKVYNAEQLAKALGATRSGTEHKHTCPAHPDEKESLTFRDGVAGKLIITCHMGCSFVDIVSAFRWEQGIDVCDGPEPFESPAPQAVPAQQSKKSKIVCADPYLDWDGTLLYEKLRMEPKDFRNRRPDGKGGYLWSLSGIKEVLFNLPGVLKALQIGETIFIVEGEKDAKNVIALGFTATCNTHGASKGDYKPKWTDYHSKFLLGPDGKLKPVLAVILKDNDQAGNAHAEAVAASLHKLGILVKVVALPGLKEKGDVSDWIADGGTKEELQKIVAATPNYGLIEIDFAPKTVSQLMSQTFEPPRWAIDDLLPEGLTILAGAPKLGKSWLALDIALCISRGDKVLGDYDTTLGEVLYLSFEDNDRRLQSRVTAIADEAKAQDNHALYYHTELLTMAQNGIEILEQWLSAHPECRLVIIDTLAKFMPPAERGVNAYQADYLVVSQLQKMALKHRIALLVVHHVRKLKSSGDVFDEVSGSTGITGPADAVWVLKRGRTENYGTLTVTGRDIEEMSLTAVFNRDTCRWSIEGDARQDDRRQLLIELHEKFGQGPFTFATAKDVLGVSLAHSKRMIAGLESSGYVNRLAEKLGKAHQFALSDRTTDVFMRGNA